MSDNPVIDEYGNKRWFKDGKRHREDGPAEIRHDGTERWFINGKKHRIGGPAVTKRNGTEFWWYQDGLLHRTDGPAIIGTDNKLWWYIRDIRIPNRQMYQKYSKLSDEDMVALILKYGEIYDPDIGPSM